MAANDSTEWERTAQTLFWCILIVKFQKFPKQKSPNLSILRDFLNCFDIRYFGRYTKLLRYNTQLSFRKQPNKTPWFHNTKTKKQQQYRLSYKNVHHLQRFSNCTISLNKTIVSINITNSSKEQSNMASKKQNKKWTIPLYRWSKLLESKKKKKN